MKTDMIIGNYRSKKIVDYLKIKSNGKIFLVFNHGLGDIINFIPIVEELKIRFPHLDFFIGLEKERKMKLLYPNIVEYDKNYFKELRRRYTYFFKINYSEPLVDTISKPYLCNENEVGLDDFVWKPYRMNIETDIIKNRVGVHFFGNTNQMNKSLTTEQAYSFWDKLEEFGKTPFEIHNPKFNTYNDLGFDFDKRPNTIRFDNPGIKEIIDEIRKCEFFIGIDSGLLYLAMSILGVERCIGIERNYSINKYAPINLNKICLKKDKWDKINFIKLKRNLK